jgi:TrmH family RNA methyltransferase
VGPLENVIVVLHRPRDAVNIGGVVRAMKNMGFRRLRLVQPARFSAAEISGVAHRSEDLLAVLEEYTSLDAALADAVYVAGTTARPREAHRVRGDVRNLAAELLARAATGPVALLFGPEDKGLDNQALDRCSSVVSLPANPAYPSLNLAQAVLLLLYELRTAATSGHALAPEQQLPREELPAFAQREALVGAVEQALEAIEFFKPGRRESIMRTLRGLLQRAEPDARETALLTAMAYEVVNFLRRRGVGRTDD